MLAAARRPQAKSAPTYTGLEALEPRQMMDGAPFFDTPLTEQFVTSADRALTIGIDGGDDDDNPLTVTAVSDNPNVTTFIPQGNRYARLTFSNVFDGSSVFDNVIILVQLFETRAPTATDRFITLAQNQVNPDGSLDPNGTPFYTDVPVYQVLMGLLFQTGDALNGDGSGGSPLGNFPDAFDPDLSFAGPGVLAMANQVDPDVPDTNDNQWFMTTLAAQHLNQQHIIFGQLITGQDTLAAILSTPVDESNRPLTLPVLDQVEIIDSPQDATLTMAAINGFVGEAQVTVTLDDGTGNTTSETFTFTSLGDQPVVTPDRDLTATADDPLSFTATDDAGLPMNLSAVASPADTVVAVDDAAGTFTVSVPAGFTGLSRVTLSAVEDGFETRTQFAEVFHVVSQHAGDPPVVGRAATNFLGNALAAFQSDDRLYVATGSGGLEVFDLTDLVDPDLMDVFVSEGASFRDVIVVNDFAFVAFNNAQQGGLAVFDVSDPTDIALIEASFFDGAAVDLIIDGDFAYLGADDSDAATDDGALHIFDISEFLDADGDTNDLFNLGFVKDVGEGVVLGHAIGLAKLGDTLFISDSQNDAVVVLNAPTSATISLLGRIVAAPDPFGLAAADDRLYVVDQNLGLFVFDVSVQINPGLMGTVEVAGFPAEIALVENIAVISTLEGFVFIDTTDPDLMAAVYTFSSPLTAGRASVLGDRLALPMGSDGVVMMDVASFANTTTFTGKLTIVDDQGIEVTVTVKNATGVITTTGPLDGDILKLQIVDAQERTTVNIKTKGGETTVGDVLFDGPAARFTAGTTNLGGHFIASSAVLRITLNHIDAGHLIDIGPSDNPKAALTFIAKQVHETTLRSAIPVKSVKTTFWRDRDGQVDQIITDWLAKLTIQGDRRQQLAGDFEPGLTLSGNGSAKHTLGKVKIADLVNGVWQITGDGSTISARSAAAAWSALFTGDVKTIKFNDVARGDVTARSVKSFKSRNNYEDGSLTLTLDTAGEPKSKALGSLSVKNTIARVNIESRGNIGKIKAMQMQSSAVAVGLDEDLPQLPATLDGFTRDDLDENAAAKLASVRIKGAKDEPFALIDTRFFAFHIDKFRVGAVDTDNGADPFGLATTSVKSATFNIGDDRFKMADLDDPGQGQTHGDFVVLLV